MTDDHIFKSAGGMFIADSSIEYVICKYCNYATFKNKIGEYLLFNDKDCLSAAEKAIKDILE